MAQRATLPIIQSTEPSEPQSSSSTSASASVSSPPATTVSSTLLRSTQRAPKSCISCSLRKVKCDQKVPCSGCVRRGIADTCTREKVLVRGVAIRVGDGTAQQGPTYDELRQENEWLRQALREATASRMESPTPVRDHPSPGQSPSHSDSNPHTHSHQKHQQAESIFSFPYAEVLDDPEPPPGSWLADVTWPPLSSILVPSRACSDALLAYDRRWNSWVHYAIDYGPFDRDHALFQELRRATTVPPVPLDQTMDPFWLALYFAVLAAAIMVMDDESLSKLDLPGDNKPAEFLVRHWYNAALVFLHRADYLRRYDVRTVQTIAVLGICFNNMGDCNLFDALWPCAVRIAQKLGMHEHPNRVRPDLDREWCRRLWWTLVVCDWLQVPFQPPCVTLHDFSVPLPGAAADTTDGTDESDRNSDRVSVQYHAVLARIALTYQQFHAAAVAAAAAATTNTSGGSEDGGDGGDGNDDDSNVKAMMAIVRRADGNLADIIAMLPPELQPDFSSPSPTAASSSSSPDTNNLQPCIPWQRWHITLILLFFRLVINRSLQQAWVVVASPSASPTSLALKGPRAICLEAARGIIRISRHWDQPMARRSRWALSLYVFASAQCLLFEIDNTTDPRERERRSEWTEEVLQCVEYLDQFKARNKIAQRGVGILRGLVNRSGASTGGSVLSKRPRE